jgi:hypothetical protein
LKINKVLAILPLLTNKLGTLKEAEMPGPMTPEEVNAARAASFPEKVFEAYNELLIIHSDGQKAELKEDDVIDLMRKKGLDLNEVYRNRWWDVDAAYRAKGWEVERRRNGLQKVIILQKVDVVDGGKCILS